jgi:hypothetical protein
VPTWSGILGELEQSKAETGTPQFDAVRRKYLARLYDHTRREIILYASKWTQHDVNVSPDVVSVTDEDLQGIMEVIHGLSGLGLDLILHSPGGSLEAADALVQYLRSKFRHIRVIVPQLAMSAATMIACAADVIVLGKHSFLGPIDPQYILATPLGPRSVPAEAIREQFERAKAECQDPRNLAAWLPMLNQYGPDLLVQCEHAREMSKELVHRASRATAIADWLADHSHFKNSRHIPRDELRARGLRVECLEKDQALQDLVLSVFHATTHTFGGTSAVKIIENHAGRAFIKHVQPILVPASPPPGGGVSPPAVPP